MATSSQSSKKPDPRLVEVEVNNIPVTYNEARRSYSTAIDAGTKDQVVVLDFAETWQNETGVLTVAVIRG
jgi:hypothetical protein